MTDNSPDRVGSQHELPPSPEATPGSAQPTTTGLRRRLRSDRLMCLLVLSLAFLLGSFLARNSDLWFHLATGRLLAEGRFSFGADPFAYTTAGAYWVCHTWLFDLGLYRLLGLVGGAGLVVLKALLVTALAGLLLTVRRRDSGSGLPVVCATLALLAMSPRLLLQPACVSYFFLGLSFWLLRRIHSGQDESGTMKIDPRSSPRRFSFPLILLFVFAAWVNIDEWFLLGPLLAALFWLGERIQGPSRIPAWLAPCGLAVCLLNPHTYHAFHLPSELAPVTWTSGLRQDGRFAGQFASPWQTAYLRAAGELNAAALAYYALSLLGVISFLVNGRKLRSWRLMIWLPFALLAAWQARAVPFFVIVAAPITVLNGQDFLARRAEREKQGAGRRRSYAVIGALRFVLCASLLALIFLAWIGGLAGLGREERNVAWGLQPEPSLQRLAEVLHQWRRQGLLRDGEHVFALSPEVAQYGAWYCSGEPHFFDHRYPLFGGAAVDYEAVCRGLLPGLASTESSKNGAARESEKEWRDVLRRQGVGIVIVYDRDPRRLFAVLHRLAARPDEWTLLHVAGAAVIFGWNEARPQGGFANLALDPERLVFGPQDDRSGEALPIAPALGPEHMASRRDFWDRLKGPAAIPTWESAAATVYLQYFNDIAGLPPRRLRHSLAACAASLAGLPAQSSGVMGSALQIFESRNLLLPRDTQGFLVRDQLGPFFRHLADRSPALPLLAVRAARRAVSANPADSSAWLRLGQAYLALRDTTCERSAEGTLPPLAQLRYIQIVTAFEQAVQLDPNLEAAHNELGYMYGEANAIDRAFEHRRDELHLSRRAGPRAGETAEECAHRLELLERDVNKLAELLAEQRERYASASGAFQGQRVQLAQLALQLGLPRQAADDILLPSPAELLGLHGMKRELELLLSLGRADEVRAILRDKAMTANRYALPYFDLPGPNSLAGTGLYALPYHWPSYEWMDVLQAAAVGDYQQADLTLRSIRAGLAVGEHRMKQQVENLKRGDWELLGGVLSGPTPFLPVFATWALDRSHQERAALGEGDRTLRAQQADLCVLEGLLALEQGVTDDARLAFVAARRLTGAESGTAVPFAGSPIAGVYLPELSVQRVALPSGELR